MRKMMAAMAAAVMMISGSAYAENMDVQMVSGPEEEMTDTEPVSLDDMKVGQSTEIDGYAEISILDYKTSNKLFGYLKGYTEAYGSYIAVYDSGADADYILLKMDITNTDVKTKEYLEDSEVKVIYDDKYEYAGWAYQYNYDNTTRDNIHAFEEETLDSKDIVIDPADVFPIDPMYDGHYAFGCTLPNKVVQGDEPLRMVISLDGNEITYNIRK